MGGGMQNELVPLSTPSTFVIVGWSGCGHVLVSVHVDVSVYLCLCVQM